jgi:GTP cyclohydrolase FolE2
LVSNQKERLKREKDNLIERQKQIEDQLAKLNENEEDRVSQQLANMLRKVDSKKLKQKNGQ